MVLFYLGFLLANFSLYSSLYFINRDRSQILPDIKFRRIFQNRSFKQAGILYSNNLDPFRISIDFSTLFLLYAFLGGDFMLYVTVIYYVFLQVYNIYHNAFIKIYGVHPVMINDWKLMRTGLGFIWNESKFRVLMWAFCLMLILAALSFVLRYYLIAVFEASLNPIIYFAWFSFIILYFLFKVKGQLYRPLVDSTFRFNFFPLRVLYNWKLCIRLKNEVGSLSKLESRKGAEIRLEEKPDVYMIFIESYGGVLLQDSELKTSFINIFDKFQEDLKSTNFYSTTNLSESISMVGPSWLAYSTALSGRRIDSNFTYEFFLNHPDASKVDTLSKFFQRQGYKSYHLNSTRPRPGISVAYERIKLLFGLDQYILHRDINYSGKEYGISVSPPDQFVLNFAREEFLNNHLGPNFLFYLTKNSHSPYISPGKPVKDWRKLNDGSLELEGSEFLKIPSKTDYVKSIDYQLATLTDFIKKDEKNNSIYIIIGDHQPHDIVHKSQGNSETLVHIISKNNDFINGFHSYGFGSGLDDINNPIKHEGIFSMITREIIRHYSNETELPDYFPNGI